MFKLIAAAFGVDVILENPVRAVEFGIIGTSLAIGLGLAGLYEKHVQEGAAK